MSKTTRAATSFDGRSFTLTTLALPIAPPTVFKRWSECLLFTNMPMFVSSVSIGMSNGKSPASRLGKWQGKAPACVGGTRIKGHHTPPRRSNAEA